MNVKVENVVTWTCLLLGRIIVMKISLFDVFTVVVFSERAQRVPILRRETINNLETLNNFSRC